MNIPPAARQPPFQPLLNEIEITRRGSDEPMILRQTGNGAVVEHDARLVADHGIAHLARTKVGEPVCVDLVEQLAGVGTFDIQLAERADVDQTYALPHSAIFFFHALLFAGA